MTPMLIHADALVDKTATAPGWLRIERGVIVDRGTGDSPSEPDQSFDALLPPFLDVHTHGARGVDFGSVGVDPGPAIAYHHENGTTRLNATIATAPLDQIKERIAELAPLVYSGELTGIHLEGPWISSRRRGAHEKSLLRAPTADELLDVVEAGGGAVRLITIAPELPGAIETIETLVAHGVVVAIGHSDADASTARRAVDAGASDVTHLFNAMSGLHHRDPGMASTALVDGRLNVELIADGRHVCEEAIALASRMAGDRLLLVSDSMAASGLGDGNFSIAGSPVEVRGGVARIVGNGALAGSTSVIRNCVDHLLGLGFAAGQIARWTNEQPAQMLNVRVPQLRRGDAGDFVGITSGRVACASDGGKLFFF